MSTHTTAEAQPLLSVTKGNPTPEELAALTAIVASLANRPAPEAQPAPAKRRVARIRKRRALTTPRLSWNLGRR
ncbi:acyl-CoA carboxylase subunit epsilon [Glutamicibacter sp. PS]|uniref:acyl-CoA carboxylase subunit epsilon n=1 Tax=Glutamicibacter TaxID=1742989 RepID=UPI002842AEDF|nr:acyl-CoA carboxylase subunit epsilon [Glutamicibacter sp. PS]MDR4533558.1 acyl-CoA carboxylase subunit epsilon [Glutamicibacter sp. PS]